MNDLLLGFKDTDTYPFYVDVNGVYYVEPLEETCYLEWLSPFFDVSYVIKDSQTGKLYYELIFYTNEDDVNFELIGKDVFCKRRLHEIIDYGVDLNLRHSDLILTYVDRRAAKAPFIRKKL